MPVNLRERAYECMMALVLVQDLNAQDQEEDPMNKLKGQKIVSCRICKGDHWTTRCPYKDTLGPMQKELAEQLGLSTGDKEKAAGTPLPRQPCVRYVNFLHSNTFVCCT